MSNSIIIENLSHVRRYLQHAMISSQGLLVVRKPNLYGKDKELIIVPQLIVPNGTTHQTEPNSFVVVL